MHILLVSDFFYPNVGGVEGHIYQLSQRLIMRGHKVVVLTHAYKNRSGIRFLTSGVKVYYIPQWLVTDQVSLPTVYSSLPLFRNIFLREAIDIVHGHQAFSSMCHESIIHARTLGLHVVFTDHSLFGFQDTSSILTNKLLKFTLSDIDHVICVSHTSKENTCLRASIDPRIVSVIPNAIVSAEFTPAPLFPLLDEIVIVVTSRLVYRKGIDLLVHLIPPICGMFPNLRFVIAGDGPKRIDLQQMLEKHILQDRMQILGAVPHEQVRDVLVQGHIFLNTSLTEAFCIAIVEAASCGLLVVSTKVGGVPEVLPPDMILFANPDPKDLTSALVAAIKRLPTHDSHGAHARVARMYSWDNVAMRTEVVYKKVAALPIAPLSTRLKKYLGVGLVAGKFSVMIIAFNHILLWIVELIWPAFEIDVCPTFDQALFRQELEKFRTAAILNESNMDCVL